MADPFATHSTSLSSPLDNAQPITPGAADLAMVPRAVMVGADGTVTGTLANGVSVTVPLLAGIVYPLRFRKITAAIATGIVGLW